MSTFHDKPADLSSPYNTFSTQTEESDSKTSPTTASAEYSTEHQTSDTGFTTTGQTGQSNTESTIQTFTDSSSVQEDLTSTFSKNTPTDFLTQESSGPSTEGMSVTSVRSTSGGHSSRTASTTGSQVPTDTNPSSSVNSDITTDSSVPSTLVRKALLCLNCGNELMTGTYSIVENYLNIIIHGMKSDADSPACSYDCT